jgi:CO/xanthine dehydrogenase FAD-binding subunit
MAPVAIAPTEGLRNLRVRRFAATKRDKVRESVQLVFNLYIPSRHSRAQRRVTQELSSAFRPDAYLKPKTEEELAGILREAQTRAKIISGGTGIYELAGRGLLSEVETLVDISGMGWRYVKKTAHSIKIGAATTMTELLQAEALTTKTCGALIDALRAIQPLQVKNVATIGGAICSGLPFFDLPTALLALDAMVRVGPGERTVRLDDFIRGYFSIDLSPQEYVREVEIPTKKGSRMSAFQKFALTSDDWAMINCGAALSLDRAGRIEELRLAFGGGVGERPVRAKMAEAALVGVKALEDDVRAVIEDQLPRELQTTSDFRSSSEYKLELAKVLGRRTIIAASKRAG